MPLRCLVPTLVCLLLACSLTDGQFEWVEVDLGKEKIRTQVPKRWRVFEEKYTWRGREDVQFYVTNGPILTPDDLRMRAGFGYDRDLAIHILEPGTIYAHVAVFAPPPMPRQYGRVSTFEADKRAFLSSVSPDSLDPSGELTRFTLGFDTGRTFIIATAYVREPVSEEDRAAAYNMIASIELIEAGGE